MGCDGGSSETALTVISALSLVYIFFAYGAILVNLFGEIIKENPCFICCFCPFMLFPCCFSEVLTDTHRKVQARTGMSNPPPPQNIQPIHQPRNSRNSQPNRPAPQNPEWQPPSNTRFGMFMRGAGVVGGAMFRALTNSNDNRANNDNRPPNPNQGYRPASPT